MNTYDISWELQIGTSRLPILIEYFQLKCDSFLVDTNNVLHTTNEISRKPYPPDNSLGDKASKSFLLSEPNLNNKTFSNGTSILLFQEVSDTSFLHLSKYFIV